MTERFLLLRFSKCNHRALIVSGPAGVFDLSEVRIECTPFVATEIMARLHAFAKDNGGPCVCNGIVE